VRYTTPRAHRLTGGRIDVELEVHSSTFVRARRMLCAAVCLLFRDLQREHGVGQHCNWALFQNVTSKSISLLYTHDTFVRGVYFVHDMLTGIVLQAMLQAKVVRSTLSTIEAHLYLILVPPINIVSV
jgi:hypothetical protein